MTIIEITNRLKNYIHDLESQSNPDKEKLSQALLLDTVIESYVQNPNLNLQTFKSSIEGINVKSSDTLPGIKNECLAFAEHEITLERQGKRKSVQWDDVESRNDQANKERRQLQWTGKSFHTQTVSALAIHRKKLLQPKEESTPKSDNASTPSPRRHK